MGGRGRIQGKNLTQTPGITEADGQQALAVNSVLSVNSTAVASPKTLITGCMMEFQLERGEMLHCYIWVLRLNHITNEKAGRSRTPRTHLKYLQP